MDENQYHFAGDPATDSPRRHLQRVLSEPEQPASKSRWPWIFALAAGGGSWTLWRMLSRRRADSEASATSRSNDSRQAGALPDNRTPDRTRRP